MKGGPFVRHVEAQTMAFVRANTSIPVPRPHKTVVDTEGTAYIIMDYVDAPELSFKSLTKDQQVSLMKQLAGYLDELRSIPPPLKTRLGALDSGPLQDPRMGTFGPFETCLDFAKNYGYTFLKKVKKPSIEGCLARFMAREHKIVFSHGDLAPHNILAKDGNIVAILDWECAGWCPDYWEAVRGLRSNVCFPEFSVALRELFGGRYDDEIELEYELENHIFRLVASSPSSHSVFVLCYLKRQTRTLEVVALPVYPCVLILSRFNAVKERETLQSGTRNSA
ncbi:hypothetical protein HGRIS_005552 [Hohenbuehelia grisea]